MGGVRTAAVAGSWYPADPARLAGEVDAHLARVPARTLPRQVRAIIAPHAGLMYSGPVAAHAYSTVRSGGYSAVVLLGPSHFVPFRGISLWPDGRWESPLANATVETELALAISARSAEIVELPAAHGREHSLEMQLPFLTRLLPGVPIVPLVMGHQTRQTAFRAGEAIAQAVEARVAQDPRPVLLVASSDLSHYEDAPTAAAMDSVVLERVAAFDAEGLMDALERRPAHACGGGPMVAILHAARQLGAAEAHVLHYADSGDVSGDKASVVGYMAAAMC